MPKTTLSFYLHMIAVAVIVFAVGNYVSSRTPDRAEGSPSIISGGSSATPRNDNRESVYDRVMRTKIIRCGYGLWSPIFMKDPNTGEFSGIYHDIMEQVANGAGLKIEWTEEIPWGDFSTAVDNGRVDMFCAPLVAAPARTKSAYFTKPLFYVDFSAYVRADDNRFNNNYEAINSENIKISVIEGELSGIVAKQNFPKAQLVEINNLVGAAQAIINVADGKADVVFFEPFSVMEYMKNNPGKIKKVPNPQPFGIFGVGMPTKLGDDKFLWLINSGLQNLLDTGYVERVFKKYNAPDDILLRVAKPYQLPAN